MGKIRSKEYKIKNGLAVCIRNAQPKDADELIDINLNIIDEKLYMIRTPGEGVYTAEAEKRKINNYLTAEGSLYITAECGGKSVGYLDFQNGGFKRTKHSGSFSIYILKDFRQKGIGELLINSMIEWAEDNPLIEKLTLAVFSGNLRAQSLYKKLGFTEEGRCPKDMKLEDGTYADSVLMYRFV